MKNQGGNTTPIKDIIKPSSPISTVSTTPNSNASSSHPSDSHNNNNNTMKSINGTSRNDLSPTASLIIGQFIRGGIRKEVKKYRMEKCERLHGEKLII